MIGVVLNVMAIMLYVMTVIHIYYKYPDYFAAMSIILIYWIQILVSSAYIETGVYLKDIGTTSYATGVTIRLVLLIELMLVVIMYWAKRWTKRDARGEEKTKISYSPARWNVCLICIYIYRLLDILVSGNIITNANVTRFNYFSEFSKFPLAQVVDYFSYPMLWIAGYNLIQAENKQERALPILVFSINVFSLLLRGIQFGGLFQCVIYFSGPTIFLLANRKKLLRVRYVAFASILLLVLLIPKYMHFNTIVDENTADTSYGLNTAYDFLIYRILAQEADLTWEIDRQIIERGQIEPQQYLEEVITIFGFSSDSDTGPQYLMNRACSSSALAIYNRGSAVVTGGYPVIWASMFGYIGAVPFLIMDSSLLAAVLRCVSDSIRNQRMFRLLGSAYILCQCYTIIVNANLGIMGNIIPRIMIVFLVCTEYRRIVIKIGNKKINIS